MSNAVNYYEELGLNKEMSIDEISVKLNQLETLWNQRMFSEPEKANRLLSIISQAKEVFSTAESRAMYDQSLTKKTQSDKTDNPQIAAYYKAKADTESFANSEQWDLAKSSIDKALSYVESIDIDDTEKADAYELARMIYYNNGLFSQAVEFANKVISLFPNDAIAYAKKAITLGELDTEMRNHGQDSSRVFKNYQTTCQIWIEKAKQSGDNQLASIGLDALARSYVNTQEYSLVYKYASEAIALDPENTGAQEVMTFLRRTRQVDMNEFFAYQKEKSPLENEILDLISQIVSSGIKPDSPDGWVLNESLSYMEIDKVWGEYEQRVDFKVVLNTNGKFERIERWEYGDNRYKVGDGSDMKKETRKYESYLESAMMVLDFKADFYKGSDEGSGYHFEHTTSVLEVSTQWERGSLTRYGCIKGKGLYDFLKNIVDKAAEQLEKQKKYDEECCRINASYYSELEPLKKRISDEYSSKKEILKRERDSAIESARQQEPQRINIQSQIDAMSREYSSLGIFSGKRKKELNSKIEEMHRVLAGIPVLKDVIAYYNQKESELNQEEHNALARLERDLRAKYPLPVKNF